MSGQDWFTLMVIYVINELLLQVSKDERRFALDSLVRYYPPRMDLGSEKQLGCVLWDIIFQRE